MTQPPTLTSWRVGLCGIGSSGLQLPRCVALLLTSSPSLSNGRRVIQPARCTLLASLSVTRICS
jgi:hypothetical protein